MVIYKWFQKITKLKIQSLKGFIAFATNKKNKVISYLHELKLIITLLLQINDGYRILTCNCDFNLILIIYSLPQH